MAGSYSDYLENKILDHLFGATTFTPPATLYAAAFTAAPTDAGGGTECSGGSYARLAITNNTTNFPNASGGSKSNGTAFEFVTATGSWGTVVYIGFFDASSSGNFLGGGDFTGVAIASGDILRVPASSLTITQT
jgi:hypothetical protein